MKVTLIASTVVHKEGLVAALGAETVGSAEARQQLSGTDAEVLTEVAGRVCYDSFGVGRASPDFHRNIVEHGHFNVLYHAHFSLFIEGISRNISHELVRHHVGFSPSMRSTRYCDERRSPVVVHPAVTAYPPAGEEWRVAYEQVVDSVRAKGGSKKTAFGAAARMLPNGISTSLVWTGNLFAFLSLIERRSIPDVVDAEFVELTVQMTRVLKPLAPTIFAEYFARDTLDSVRKENALLKKQIAEFLHTRFRDLSTGE